MRKVEMGNGIGCISGGEGEWTTLAHFPPFQPSSSSSSSSYTLPALFLSLSPFLSPFLSITLASRLDPSRFRSIFLSPRNLAVLCPDTVPPLTGRWLKGSIPSHRALWKELMDHRISVNALCADYPQSRVEIGFPINTFVIIYPFYSCFLFYPEFAYTFVS